jgi:hypothetical protein
MPNGMRVTETDLVVPALRVAAERGGYVSTEDLIAALECLFSPTGKDAEYIEGRNDTYFSQKVRNLICHRRSPSSFIARGLADYNGHGIRITALGLALLDQVTVDEDEEE